MKSFCRFCRKKNVRRLFSSNRTKSVTPAAFACTNCGFGQHGPIAKCRSCGLIYVDENVSQQKISTYYEVAADPLYFAEQEARKKTFHGYLDRLEKAFPRKGRLLDVGTNTGLFVRLARDRGWQADGIEPNRWAAKFAREHYKINLINKPFEKESFPPESFEVITMWDVIEHFTDPVEQIKTVYYQLKPGGLFAFSTVDPASPLARIWGTNWSWYMDMHRTFFTRLAAKLYLEKAGFTKVVFMSHWRFLSLGYLSSRLVAINRLLAAASSAIIASLGLSKTIVPYYANDLFDCYAVKS